MNLTLKQIEKMETVDDLMLTGGSSNIKKATQILFDLGLIKSNDVDTGVAFYQNYAFKRISSLAKQHEEG